MPDNEERATRASVVLSFYTQKFGEDEADLAVNLTDLLTDILHLAHTTQQHSKMPRISFEKCVSMAKQHFEAELSETD